MRKLLSLGLIGLWFTGSKLAAQTNPPGTTVETLVCFRHGEKPPDGLGQLTCQGLNRALALPSVLLAKFGRPHFLFACNPSQTIPEYGGNYSYIRPLMTIEPTAIYCGLPVNAQFGFREFANLEAELDTAPYHNATIFIAWEHVTLVTFMQDIVKAYGGDETQIPYWPSADYDTIFVIRITRVANHATVAFSIDHEGLNNLGSGCPVTEIRPMRADIGAGQFGFDIVGITNALVVVEASTNLAASSWARLSTNVLAGGVANFHDSTWTNYGQRYYRLSLP